MLSISLFVYMLYLLVFGNHEITIFPKKAFIAFIFSEGVYLMLRMTIKFTINFGEKNDLQWTYDVNNVYKDADFLPVA